MDLTNQQAKAEAHRRWGDRARTLQDSSGRRHVGRINRRGIVVYLGSGWTWREAFDQAHRLEVTSELG
jgi:hypothetical protein